MKYIDMHSHIFPSGIAAKVVQELEKYYGFRWFGTGEQDDLAASLEEAEIDRSVIFSCATKPQQVEHINDYIHGLQTEYPEKFIGFGTMHPAYEDYKTEIQRIRSLGLKGLKFHPDFQQFYVDDPGMLRVYEAAGEDMVLLFHIGDKNNDFSSPRRLANVLKSLPGLKIVAAHMGGYSQWDQALDYLVGKDVWLDTSSTMPMLSAEKAAEIAKAHGIEKILYASDYPAVRHTQSVQHVLDMGFTEEENEKIFCENAEKLLNIKL